MVLSSRQTGEDHRHSGIIYPAQNAGRASQGRLRQDALRTPGSQGLSACDPDEITGCILFREMQPGRLPGGEPDKPDIDSKKSPAHRPQAPTWSVEPGIGTTIIADVQSASARQRSSCRRGIAATSAPEATQARGCDGPDGPLCQTARQVTCFAATPWPKTIRTARPGRASRPPNQEAARPGIAAPSTGSSTKPGS
jgi:hypothetical protein